MWRKCTAAQCYHRDVKRTSLAALCGVALTTLVSACASAPPLPPPKPLAPPIEQQIGWILRLEDQRVLRDTSPMVPPALPEPGKPATIPPPPPDLLRLLKDGNARTRQRAALAVGRVGLREGTPALVEVLKDVEPEVREMAAFALGLIADPSTRDPLVTALDDPSPLVKGAAAEALGLLGDAAAAPAIGRMATAIVDAGMLATLPPDADDSRRDSPAAAYRFALYALARLKAFEPMAAAALDAKGQPRVHWWPVAYALQRIEDPRTVPALLALTKDPHPYTRAFAAKGLGPLKDRSAVAALLPMVTSTDRSVAVEAIRSLGRLGDPSAAPALLKIVVTPKGDPQIRVEAVAALGGVAGEGVADTLLDALADPNPPVRSAALRSLADLDREGFVTILSGLDPDKHWSVRATLATVLGTLPLENGLPRLTSMLSDSDSRVIPAVLTSLAKLHAPDAPQVLAEYLKHDDPVIRAAAATALGELKPPNVTPALTEAYKTGQRDVTYVARSAALGALAMFGAAEATPVLTSALSDKDWAVRVRAAALLKQLDPSSDADLRIRPAPQSHTGDFYTTARLTNPPVSTQIYIETDRGLIQIEMAVLDAPLTVDNFITLARKKFFDGVTFHRVVADFVVQGGDPRSDGEGGPGYTIRDEMNMRPYLRGVVGMALDWADTGGSQFFITHSPQPHLDGRYTVFGRVTGGMEIVDQIQPWEVIRRVIVWDGESLQ
jgi:HEAT repeat protein/cyclophilin family peptidyl-prolyl cis-trans isomerase